jgi:hypothetical protein
MANQEGQPKGSDQSAEQQLKKQSTKTDLDKPNFGLTDEEISRMMKESEEEFQRYGDFE